jgi:UDP-glucuronate decarboxylase
MNILITGGAGFIGSHLCEFLLNNGNKIICLDNFFTGRRENIKHLEKNGKFEVIAHDITSPLREVVHEHIDQIYNLACPASPVHYQFDPIETVKANTIGVINILEFAKLNGSRILQASTSEVYGDPEVHPQVENYRGNVNMLGPRSCYDEGKRIAETLFMDYHRKCKLDIRIVRIFNTYGPRMALDDGRVISNFIIQALKNKDITVFGDGSQTRSFCYVNDLIEGLYSTMNNHHIGPINLGNTDEIRIMDAAKKIKEITESSSKIVFRPLPEDDPMKRKPDIALAKEKLNWWPKIEFDEGVKKTIDYFNSVLSD